MHTLASLTADLRSLWPSSHAPTHLLVHSGFRAFGQVEGGPDTVVAALRAALGPDATFAAPTFTTNLTDPYVWTPTPSETERQRILAEMPAYDPAVSVPWRMGAVADAVWRTPGAVRSAHPVTSWAALGPDANALTRDIPVDDPEGRDGTLGRVWQRDGWVLLLGVDHDANTTIHLAESLLEMPHLLALVDRWPDDGARPRVWREIRKSTKCSDGFVALGPFVDRLGLVRKGRVGDADARLMRSRALVAAVCERLGADPTALLCGDPACVHCPTSRRLLTGWTPAPPG